MSIYRKKLSYTKVTKVYYSNHPRLTQTISGNFCPPCPSPRVPVWYRGKKSNQQHPRCCKQHSSQMHLLWARCFSRRDPWTRVHAVDRKKAELGNIILWAWGSAKIEVQISLRCRNNTLIWDDLRFPQCTLQKYQTHASLPWLSWVSPLCRSYMFLVDRGSHWEISGWTILNWRSLYHWIGLREHLQETAIFNG